MTCFWTDLHNTSADCGEITLSMSWYTPPGQWYDEDFYIEETNGYYFWGNSNSGWAPPNDWTGVFPPERTVFWTAFDQNAENGTPAPETATLYMGASSARGLAVIHYNLGVTSVTFSASSAWGTAELTVDVSTFVQDKPTICAQVVTDANNALSIIPYSPPAFAFGAGTQLPLIGTPITYSWDTGRSLNHLDGNFIVVGKENGAFIFSKSADGTSWATADYGIGSASNPNPVGSKIVKAGTRYVVMRSASGADFRYSTNLTDWNNTAAGLPNRGSYYWVDMCAISGRLIVIGGDGATTRWAYSDDGGDTWTESATGVFGAAQPFALATNGTTAVAPMYGTTTISVYAGAWSGGGSAPVTGDWVAGCWNGSYYFFIDSANRHVIKGTSDGGTWVSATDLPATIGVPACIATDNSGRICVGGDGGFVAISADNGSLWTTSAVPSGWTGVTALASDGTNFVAMTASPDAVTGHGYVALSSG